MSTNQLPIEIVQTKPYKFRWCRVVDGPNGVKKVWYKSGVIPALESTLVSLIKKLDNQIKENDVLHREIDKLKAELKSATDSVVKIAPTSTLVEQPKQAPKKTK